ncbi:MAG: hypothetical protein BWY06_02471 [Candidatus Latescibacteria bacterium ADurb.Bin168]|nr:MAG: hypothetical protein BWY06_02471 [Candidatus Latescibacteria bacterium ADurb.Bin168]
MLLRLLTGRCENHAGAHLPRGNAFVVVLFPLLSQGAEPVWNLVVRRKPYCAVEGVESILVPVHDDENGAEAQPRLDECGIYAGCLLVHPYCFRALPLILRDVTETNVSQGIRKHASYHALVGSNGSRSIAISQPEISQLNDSGRVRWNLRSESLEFAHCSRFVSAGKNEAGEVRAESGLVGQEFYRLPHCLDGRPVFPFCGKARRVQVMRLRTVTRGGLSLQDGPLHKRLGSADTRQGSQDKTTQQPAHGAGARSIHRVFPGTVHADAKNARKMADGRAREIKIRKDRNACEGGLSSGPRP